MDVEFDMFWGSDDEFSCPAANAQEFEHNGYDAPRDTPRGTQPLIMAKHPRNLQPNKRTGASRMTVIDYSPVYIATIRKMYVVTVPT